MFGGIGFFELLLIFVVGLFVIGPKELPNTIKTCALWFGRIKRNLLETRREIEQQLGADEIRRELHNEQVMASLEKFRSQADDLRDRIEGHMNNPTPPPDLDYVPEGYVQPDDSEKPVYDTHKSQSQDQGDQHHGSHDHSNCGHDHSPPQQNPSQAAPANDNKPEN